MFGTRSSSQLTAWVASCESCRKNCTVTRIGRLWNAILVTDDAHVPKVCTVTDSAGGVGQGGGGGIPLGGIGIYTYMYERGPFRACLTPSLAYLFNYFYYFSCL